MTHAAISTASPSPTSHPGAPFSRLRSVGLTSTSEPEHEEPIFRGGCVDEKDAQYDVSFLAAFMALPSTRSLAAARVEHTYKR